ncbi:replication initiation factor domain-containing protein [Microcoleus sp. herbarium14]|uniref:replication initiation factor domain-containing protein n=1 Tax=Microcoleus sp. herbarium14 TaxID=3055439 RepID=UPI002FD2B87D
MADVRDTNVLGLNKVWHEVHEFQGSLIGVFYSPDGSDKPHKYFVDLNGSTLAGVDFLVVSQLLFFAQYEDKFVANRIDIALDFPLQSPRLSMRHWESFVVDKLICGYRTVRRVSGFGGSRFGTTVYLGSRESDRFVRIYDKNIDGVDYDRLEVEFKRFRAQDIMERIAVCSVDKLPELLNGVVCSQIKFSRFHSDIEFFKSYSFGPVQVPAPVLHLDIEKSIAFIERHCATLAMVEEFMGVERYDKFMRSQLAAGKLRMRPRHRIILKAAQFLGVTAVGILFVLIQTSGAIASNLVCPAPVSLQSQMVQKFPIDIAMPNPAEQQFLNAVGDGCFQINSGLKFDKICLPGMIVNALRPFVIMGLGIKFIFSD